MSLEFGEIDWKKTISIGLAAISFGLVHVQLMESFGFSPSLTIAAIVAVSFFLGIAETVLISLALVLLLNWHPGLSMESAFLVALPFAAQIGKNLIFGGKWALNLIFISVAVILFYALMGASVWNGNLGVLFQDMILSVFIGGSFFFVLNYVYNPNEI